MRIEGIEGVADALQQHGELSIDLGLYRMGEGLLQSIAQGSPRAGGHRGREVAGELLQIEGGGQSRVGHAHGMKLNHAFAVQATY